MLRQTPEEAVIEQRAHQLAVTIFPKEFITEEFKELLKKALPYNSVLRTKCHELTWMALCLMDRDLAMPEVQLAIDIVKAATPIELEQTLAENADMIYKIIIPIKAKWDEIDVSITDSIKRKVETQLKITQTVPISKKVFK